MKMTSTGILAIRGGRKRHGAVITVPGTVAQPYLSITAMVLVQRTPFQLLKTTQLQQCVVHQPSTVC